MKEINSKKYTLHFFPFEKFTESVITFFNNNYNLENNIFILYGNEKSFIGNLDKLLLNENVILKYKLTKKNYIKLIRNSKKLIYHQFHVINIFKLLFLKKRGVYTLFWGADLEGLKISNSTGLKSKIKRYLAKYCFKYVIPINLIENDFKVLSTELNISINKHFIARYYSDQYEKQLSQLPYKKKNDIPKILIGNSATISNNHKEILNILKRFSNQNIEIYIPLSYGDEKYAMEIKKYAIKYFGNKIHILDKFMSCSEYNDFLNNIDIGIFNYHRQQGLGNINRLLLLQKKVYVNKKSGLFDYYKNQGIKLYETSLLENSSFENIIKYDEEDYNNNRTIQIKSISNTKIVEEWNLIFND